MEEHIVVYTLIFADLFGGLGINTFNFLSQLFSFAIVFLILWRWGFPAIIRTMERRQAVIREGIENAERAKRELQEANQRAEQIILEARRQAQEIIAQATKAAEREACLQVNLFNGDVGLEFYTERQRNPAPACAERQIEPFD